MVQNSLSLQLQTYPTPLTCKGTVGTDKHTYRERIKKYWSTNDWSISPIQEQIRNRKHCLCCSLELPFGCVLLWEYGGVPIIQTSETRLSSPTLDPPDLHQSLTADILTLFEIREVWTLPHNVGYRLKAPMQIQLPIPGLEISCTGPGSDYQVPWFFVTGEDSGQALGIWVTHGPQLCCRQLLAGSQGFLSPQMHPYPCAKPSPCGEGGQLTSFLSWGGLRVLEFYFLALKAGKPHTEALAVPVSLRAVSAPKMARWCYLLTKGGTLYSHTAKQKRKTEGCLLLRANPIHGAVGGGPQDFDPPGGHTFGDLASACIWEEPPSLN